MPNKVYFGMDENYDDIYWYVLLEMDATYFLLKIGITWFIMIY